MFRNIKISIRLTISFATLIVFMIVLIGISIKQIKTDNDNLNRIVNFENINVRLANSMIDNAREVALSVRGLLLRKYGNKSMGSVLEMKNEWMQKWQSFDQNMMKAEKQLLQEDAEGKHLLINIKTSGKTAHELTTRAIEIAMSGKINEATDFVFSTAYPSVLLWIKANQGYVEHSEEQTAIFYEQAHAGQEQAFVLIVILGCLAIVLSVVIVIILTLSITKPLKLIVNAADNIAAGDLTTNLSSNDERRDEFGLLINAFSTMIEKLRGSIKEIIEGITLLGSSASEILAATTQVASGTVETATAISETTTTVEEVRQAAELSNQKASRVSENARQVAQVTQTGQTAVDETVNGMHGIQNQMETMAGTIIRLSEQSQQIGGIIASVTDVADQSNLLAVNASIEAAKAGEQGKGFAVVAEEIKSLAQQSKEATIQVRNILNDIQKATSAAVMATEQTSKAVESGVKQSTQAGEAINKLAESSDKALEAASQIVASSQQQVVGMDQIGIAMTNINQAGTENAASMLQAEKAAKGLNELGQKLKLLVEQYKI